MTLAPAVVAVGGGHGLAVSLQAICTYAQEITAIVTVADDGGSSGRLRSDLGGPAMGDMRLCLSAMAPDQSIWRQVSEHRFGKGDLAGHAAGNLILHALAAETGDWVQATDQLGQLIGARGRVLPATCEPVTLVADVASTAAAERVEGQVAVATTAPVDRLYLEPSTPTAPAEAVDALDRADQIVLGPGSLFTSVLAASIVPGIRQAIAGSKGRRVYVANLGEQRHETSGFSVADHVAALNRHGIPIDNVVLQPGALKRGEIDPDLDVTEAQVARQTGAGHDPELLGPVLAALL